MKNEDFDSWKERTIAFYEMGNCPICFCTDEAGHGKGCYINELEQQAEKMRDALEEICRISCGEDQVADDDSVVIGGPHYTMPANDSFSL
jgi:hypothetical protein